MFEPNAMHFRSLNTILHQNKVPGMLIPMAAWIEDTLLKFYVHVGEPVHHKGMLIMMLMLRMVGGILLCCMSVYYHQCTSSSLPVSSHYSSSPLLIFNIINIIIATAIPSSVPFSLNIIILYAGLLYDSESSSLFDRSHAKVKPVHGGDHHHIYSYACISTCDKDGCMLNR